MVCIDPKSLWAPMRIIWAAFLTRVPSQKIESDLSPPSSSRHSRCRCPTQLARPEISQWSTRSKWSGFDWCPRSRGLGGVVLTVEQTAQIMRIGPQRDFGSMYTISKYLIFIFDSIRNGLTSENKTCHLLLLPMGNLAIHVL